MWFVFCLYLWLLSGNWRWALLITSCWISTSPGDLLSLYILQTDKGKYAPLIKCSKIRKANTQMSKNACYSLSRQTRIVSLSSWVMWITHVCGVSAAEDGRSFSSVCMWDKVLLKRSWSSPASVNQEEVELGLMVPNRTTWLSSLPLLTATQIRG